jgi:DNA replication protein DnaC
MEMRGCLPPRYGDITATHPDMVRIIGSKGITRLQRAALTKGSVVLLGPAGKGKTVGAVIVARGRLAARIDAERQREEIAHHPHGGYDLGEVAWVSVPDLAGIRRRYPLGQGDPPEIEKAKYVPTLILDELGSEDPASRAVAQEIIWARYDAGLPMITTSWMTVEQLAAEYGGGIGRRIMEGATIINLHRGGW